MQLEAFKFRLVKVRGIAGVHEEERCYPTGSGVIEVPEEQGYDLKKMRIRDPRDNSYIRYLAPEDVEENLRLGTLEAQTRQPEVAPAPERRGPGRPPKASFHASSDDE